MSEPEWYARALAEGRILADTGVAWVPTDSMAESQAPSPKSQAEAAEAVEFEIPPSTNALWIVCGKARVKSPAYRAWLARVAGAVGRIPPPDPPPSLAAPVRVVVTVHGRKGFRRSRDVDNVLKPTLDACVANGVLVGDSVMSGVWEAVARYRPDPRRPGPPVVTVHFERLDPGEWA